MIWLLGFDFLGKSFSTWKYSNGSTKPMSVVWSLWGIYARQKKSCSYISRDSWLSLSWWNIAIAIKSRQGRIWLNLKKLTDVLVYASMFGAHHKEKITETMTTDNITVVLEIKSRIELSTAFPPRNFILTPSLHNKTKMKSLKLNKKYWGRDIEYLKIILGLEINMYTHKENLKQDQ